MAGSVILAGARTPIGKLSGALAGFKATDLGGIAIKAALERAGVAPEQIDAVLMGSSPPVRRPSPQASPSMSPPPPSTRYACRGSTRSTSPIS
jgi:acetyl-CoA acetyltransferase